MSTLATLDSHFEYTSKLQKLQQESDYMMYKKPPEKPN